MLYDSRPATLAVIIALGCPLVAGCGDDVASDSGDMKEKAQSHIQRVAACDAKYRPKQASATSKDWELYFTCLMVANNSAVSEIETSLSAASSQFIGKTRDTIERSRDEAYDVCRILVDSSDSATGSLAKIYAAECEASRERDLAELIDIYVDLRGQKSISDEEIRQDGREIAYFNACFTQAGSGTPVEIAHTNLSCLRENVMATVTTSDGIVDRIMENYPERTRAEVEAAANSTFSTALDVNGSLCALFGDASEDNAGGDELTSVVCQQNSVFQFGRLEQQFCSGASCRTKG